MRPHQNGNLNLLGVEDDAGTNSEWCCFTHHCIPRAQLSVWLKAEIKYSFLNAAHLTYETTEAQRREDCTGGDAGCPSITFH